MGDRAFRTLRGRQAEAEAGRDGRRGESVTQGPALLVEVFAEATVPTATGKYFACHPVVLGGVEAEGETPSFAADAAQALYVAVLGGTAPEAGDRLLARLVGGRWLAESGGASTPPVPCATDCLQFTACSLPLSNAAVTLKLGATVVGTCTTDAVVTAVTVTNPGASTSEVPIISFFGGGGGTGAAAFAVMRIDVLHSLGTFGAFGTGYTVNDILTLAGGTGSILGSVKVLGVDGGGGVTSMQIQSFGAYTVLPPVDGSGKTAVTGGTGTGATFAILYQLAAIGVTDGGSGYTLNPVPIFTGGATGGMAASVTRAGKCCIPFHAAGTYTIEYTTSNGQTGSFSQVLTCTDSASSITVTPASGYACTRNPCCPDADQPGPPPFTSITFPSTLTWSDPFGSVTLNRIGTSNVWDGYADRVATTGYIDGACATSAGVTVPVYIRVGCPGSTLFSGTIYLKSCGSPSLYPAAGAHSFSGWPGGGLGSSDSLGTVTTCLPVTLASTRTYSTATSVGSMFVQIYGTSPVNFTVSA